MDRSKSMQYTGDKSPLTTAEEQRLARLIQETGDRDAINKLVEHNLRFAFRIARKYVNATTTVDDLFQEACLGMMRSAEKFEPGRGRFISYAVHLIKAHCQALAMSKSGPVAYPTHTKQNMMRLHSKMKSDPHLIDNASPRDVAHLMYRGSEIEAEAALSAMRTSVSLNQPKHGKDESREDWIDNVRSDAPEPSLSAERASLVSVVEEAIESLPERKREALKMRWFGDGPGSRFRSGKISETQCTLDEIGEAMGYSRERARQVLEECYDLLAENEKLREFV